MDNQVIQLQGQVGARQFADGASGGLRLSRTGALNVSDSHGRYREAVSRGNVYVQAVKTATVTATINISPMPGPTGSALLAVLNPPNSGKTLSILKVGISNVSGTPGGPLYFDVLANCGVTAAGTGQSTPINAGTLQAGGGVARGYAQTVPAMSSAAIMLRPIGGMAAISLGAGVAHIDEFVDGSIEVPPGAILIVSAHATGTSHVLSGYLAWEEIPIV